MGTMPSNEILEPDDHVSPAEAPGPRIPFALRWLTWLVVLPLLALATAFFGSISLLVGLWDSSGRQQHFIARTWARILLRIALSPVTVEGLEKLQPLRRREASPHGRPSRRPLAVYASNHLSYYDTPMLFAKLPFQFRILAKGSLWKLPFIGWYLNRSGQVPIDQSSARAGVASLMRGVKTLEAGLPLMLFPEGGRSPTGELKSMVAGAAWMAIKARVPLVPITLIGTYELLPIHTYVMRPRPLKLIIGDPLLTTGLATRDAEALMARLRSVIHDTYIANHVD
jgi:1-acyl-sn-glycerol-3-phosphate acyltransferase